MAAHRSRPSSYRRAHAKRKGKTARGGPVALFTSVAACALVAGALILVVSKVSPDNAGASSATQSDQSQSLALLSSNPTSGSVGVDPDTPVSLQFDAPLAARSPLPMFNPPLSGTWVRSSSEDLVFEASQSLPPGDSEQVTVPGGPDGIATTDGRRLEQSATIRFTVAPMSTLRLQELLGQLGYLPLSFTPSAPHLAPTENALPVAGTFAWRWPTLPAALTSLWAEGQPNVVTTGAVMAFESQHQLETDGAPGPQVWNALLAAASEHEGDTYGHYDFVEVSTSIPERVAVSARRRRGLHHPGEHGHRGGSDREGHLARLRPLRVHDDVGHEPRRKPLRRSRRAVGQLLPWR